MAGIVRASARQAAPASLLMVFDRVTVVGVEQGTLVPAQRVVIAGNRVHAVGNANTVELSKSAQVVDVRGNI